METIAATDIQIGMYISFNSEHLLRVDNVYVSRLTNRICCAGKDLSNHGKDMVGSFDPMTQLHHDGANVYSIVKR
jgi:hypothetical protein